jgi:hypothetical protein
VLDVLADISEMVRLISPELSILVHQQIMKRYTVKFYILCGAGTAYTTGTPEITAVFSGILDAQYLVFCVLFRRQLLFLLFFFIVFLLPTALCILV